jgi:G3E family GTPase
MTDTRADGRMRLTLLGGFLGSGKTTWLRHQLHAGSFVGAHVIVNEAAATPVDDALLTRASAIEVVSGGCACCDAREDLVARLRRLCDLRSRTPSGEQRLDQIVLETSGLADPAAILDAIRTDAMLVHHILVGETVVCVDALHGLSQLMEEPLGRRQAEAADRLVVTKLDEADRAGIGRLVATLETLNPGAAIAGAIKGEPVSAPSAAGQAPVPLPALDASTSAPIFPTRLTLDDQIDWTAFGVWLSALLHARGDDVMRVKGVVRTPAGRMLLQTVRKVVQSPEILPAQEEREDDTIVVIGRGYREEDLRRSLNRFAGVKDRGDISLLRRAS